MMGANHQLKLVANAGRLKPDLAQSQARKRGPRREGAADAAGDVKVSIRQGRVGSCGHGRGE